MEMRGTFSKTKTELVTIMFMKFKQVQGRK